MSPKDWIKGRVADLDAWARPWAARSRLNAGLYEFLLFGLKQAWACLFGGAMVALLLATHFWWPRDAWLARYDFLLVSAVAIQGLLLATRLERWDEAVVILVFHVVGTVMEVFKTAEGSWIYPEANLFRIGGVPLFSGFMYGAIGSYIARAWRLFEMEFEGYPPLWGPWLLAVLSYINFFSHHFIPDIRWGLFAFSVLLFGRAWFRFTPDLKVRRMPMLLGFLLVALFIWIAENVGTFTATWIYPQQAQHWRPVSLAKLGSWYLLMMLSFVLVTLVHRPRNVPRGAPPSTQPLAGEGASS